MARRKKTRRRRAIPFVEPRVESANPEVLKRQLDKTRRDFEEELARVRARAAAGDDGATELLRELARALGHGAEASLATPTRPSERVSGTRDTPDPGQSTRRFRRAYHDLIADIRKITFDYWSYVDGRGDKLPHLGRGPRCWRRSCKQRGLTQAIDASECRGCGESFTPAEMARASRS